MLHVRVCPAPRSARKVIVSLSEPRWAYRSGLFLQFPLFSAGFRFSSLFPVSSGVMFRVLFPRFSLVAPLSSLFPVVCGSGTSQLATAEGPRHDCTHTVCDLCNCPLILIQQRVATLF